MHALSLLREMGLDPSSEGARRAVGLVRDSVTWRGCGPEEADDNTFFAGEVEPCINGQVAAPGAYFGQDVQGIIDRLLGEQLGDGGWNCEAPNGSTRSSFNTTICVLEALLEHERAGRGGPAVTAARLRGQEYLLERRLFRRRSTGEVIDVGWTRFAFPTWWHYDVLRGLEYLRSPASRRTSASPRRSTWSRPSATTTAGGRSRPDIPARCSSRRTRARAGRAGGTPSAPCECWTGTRHETDPTDSMLQIQLEQKALALPWADLEPRLIEPLMARAPENLEHREDERVMALWTRLASALNLVPPAHSIAVNTSGRSRPGNGSRSHSGFSAHVIASIGRIGRIGPIGLIVCLCGGPAPLAGRIARTSPELRTGVLSLAGGAQDHRFLAGRAVRRPAMNAPGRHLLIPCSLSLGNAARRRAARYNRRRARTRGSSAAI